MAADYGNFNASSTMQGLYNEYARSRQSNNINTMAQQAETSGKKAAKNIANAWEKAGEEAGVKIANHIGEQLKRVANDFLHTMGKLDIVGSFSKGLDMAKNFRQEYGKYAIGTSSLKDLSNTITGAFKQMQQNGVIIDPQEIYNSLGTVKQMVSLAGTQVDKLTEISATVSMIAKTGISINTTNQSSNYLRQQFGTEVLSDINARLNLVSTQFQNYTEDLANTIYNSPILQQIETHLRKSTSYQLDTQAGQQALMLRTIENLNQTVGVIADNFNKDAASQMYEMYQKSMSGQLGFGDMYGSVLGQYMNQYLTHDTWSEQGKAYYTSAQGQQEWFTAFIQGVKDLGKQGWLNATTWNNISAMSGNTGITWETIQSIINDSSDVADIVKQMSTQVAIDYAKADDDNVYARITDATMTAIDKLNARSTLAGYQAGTITYQDAVLQNLSLVVQLLQNVFGEGTLGQIAKSLGGSLLEGVASGTSQALIRNGLDASSSSGNNVGGKAGAIVAGITAIAATTALIVEENKKWKKERNEQYAQSNASLDKVRKNTSLLDKINDDVHNIANPDEGTDNATKEGRWAYRASIDDGKLNLTAVQVSSDEEAEQIKSWNARAEAEYAKLYAPGSEGQRYNNPAMGNVGRRGQQSTVSPDKNALGLLRNAALQKQYSGYSGLYQMYSQLGYLSGDTSDTDFYNNFKHYVDILYSDSPSLVNGEGKEVAISSLLANSAIQDDAELFGKLDALNNSAKNKDMDAEMQAAYNGYDEINSKSADELFDIINSFEKGIDNVPEDGYLARLHAGEMVIPAKRANFLRRLWGQPTKRESKVPANILTGSNGLVQGIPEYASGTDGNPYLIYRRASAKEQGRVDPELEKLLLAFTMAMGQPSLQISWGMRPANWKSTSGFSKSLHKLGLAADVQGWAKNDVKRGTENAYGLARNAKNTDGSWEWWHYTPSWATSYDAMVEKGYPRIAYSPVPDGTKVYASDIGGVTPVAAAIGTQIDNATQSAEGKTSNTNIIQSIVGKYGMNWLSRRFGAIASAAQAVGSALGIGGADNAGTGVLVGALATIRQQLKSAMSDSDLLAFFNRTRREVGGQGDQAIQAFMETIFNRAASRGRSIYQTVTGAYYGKNNDGGLSNALSSDMLAKYTSILDAVLGGSNITNFATGNASGNVGFGYGNGKNDPYTLMVNGERFGIENGKDVTWVNNMKAQLNMLAEGGIVKSTPGGVPAIIGEGKNDEAVIPLNDQNDYLGLQEATVTIIDVLDEFCNVVCKRLDEIMSMQKEYIGLDTSVTKKQVSTRLENLKQFNYNY